MGAKAQVIDMRLPGIALYLDIILPSRDGDGDHWLWRDLSSVVSYRIMPRGGVYVKPLPQTCVGACEGVASRSEGGQSVLRRSARHTAVESGSGRVGVAGDETRDVVLSQ